ncbi:hypothetical protein HHL11_25835 [Ramlibacter sp. G-1-2-2]|uniref:Uncharacterized protein n=2 Tax=Ramlibacter agri TaxID=2728837 RepID=A0A848H9M7_9BURK|nr:hypothetical protein [Ramlibacter agri]
MQNDPNRRQDADDDGTERGDAPIPRASDDEVLDDTARLAREGRKQLESDPKESKPAKD